MGLPAINLSWYPARGERIAQCTVDPVISGQMGAEYFLSAGHKQFAFCGPLRELGYRDGYAESFCKALKKKGFSCNVYQSPGGDQQTVPWGTQLASLVDWLTQLPRPVAMLCWSAARGRQVTEACHYAGIRVPDEVSVLGGDHDELMSHISSPPLSTIDQPAEQIGYEAARLLEGMMRGKKPRKRPLLLPPTRIIVRHSTDTLAIDDEIVRDALQLIRNRRKRESACPTSCASWPSPGGHWNSGSCGWWAARRPPKFAACGSRPRSGCWWNRIGRSPISAGQPGSATRTCFRACSAAAWGKLPASFASSISTTCKARPAGWDTSVSALAGTQVLCGQNIKTIAQKRGG